MPVFSLRLPETLEADARAKAAWLGISMNAFVCVAVDARICTGVALQPVAEPAIPTLTPTPSRLPITTPEPVKTLPVRLPTRQERRKLERLRLRAKAASWQLHFLLVWRVYRLIAHKQPFTLVQLWHLL